MDNFFTKSKDQYELTVDNILLIENYRRDLVVYLNGMNYKKINYHKEHYKKNWLITEIKDVTKWLKSTTN